MATRGFVRGALLLAGAAMISKLLGSIYTIILQNIIGDHGMGLFQMAYPVYATLLAIATAGFPVAISKLVSEEAAYGDHRSARAVLKVSLWFLSILGVICFFVLYFGAGFWARIAGDPAAKSAIQAIAPALLMVPVLSAVRGYFQGYQWMEPTAVSQVLEQLIRVVTIVGLAGWLITRGYSERIAAAGAAFGAVTGASAGILAICYFWWRRERVIPPSFERSLPTGQIIRRLLYYALPISLGALVVPLMNNVDVMTVVNLLKDAGEGQNLATTQFGLLSGRAFKLMMLPTTLASGIGIAAMPAISEARALGKHSLVRNRIDLALRLTMVLAMPAMVGLFLLAMPINITLFQDAAGTTTIQMLALSIVFASLQTTVAALLQGSGYVYLPVLNLFIACIVKLLANLLLVPHFGIAGAAFATVISYVVAAVLNVLMMIVLLKERFDWGNWVFRPLTATFIMGAAVFALTQQWMRFGGGDLSRGLTAVLTLAILGVGIIIYLVASVVSGSMSSDELVLVPRIGPYLVRVCRRLGLLR